MKTKEKEFNQTILKKLAKGKRRQHKIRHKVYKKFYKRCLKNLNYNLNQGKDEAMAQLPLEILNLKEFKIFDSRDKRDKAVEIVSRFIKIKHPLINCTIDEDWWSGGDTLILTIKYK